MTSNLSVSRDVRSSLSTASRRDVLWNVSQPGDPYDIRRSMIASLPGDKKKFMGDHLELVCLLQAAEIQRLCEFLDDYKLKFRQVERSNLDRHSYEIQIKQLIQKVGLEQSLRNQNNKLKQFSKRLQSEIQQLQRNSRSNISNQEQNKINYQKSLERITFLSNQNRQLTSKYEESKYQIQNLSARYEALQKAKNKEIEETKLYFSQTSKEQYQSSLLSLRLQGESQIKRLQYEIKRLKENNDSKNIQISDLQKNFDSALNEINNLRARTDGNYHLQRQIIEYENKFILFGQEIQRLNITLRDYTIRLQQSQTKRRQSDRKLQNLQKQNNDLIYKIQSRENEINNLNESLRNYESQNLKIRSNQQVIYQYQSKLNLIKIENEKLNSQLKYQFDNSKRYKEEIEKLSFENSRYKLLEKENLNLKSNLGDLSNLKRNIAQLQNKNGILIQEIERVSSSIKNKDFEIQKYKAIAIDNQKLKNQVRQYQYLIKNKYQLEINRLEKQYQNKIELINRTKGTDQYKIENYEREIDKLRKMLEMASNKNETVRNSIYEHENASRRRQIQIESKIRNYESNISSLRHENESLLHKIKLLDGNNLQLQNKINNYQRAHEGNSLNLKSRDEEIIHLRNKLRDTQDYFKSDLTKTKVTFEQNFGQVISENEELKRRYNDLVNESNKKLLQVSQQFERLNNKLRNESNEKAMLQNDKRLLQQQNDVLKQNINKMKQQYDELRKRNVDFQNKLTLIQNDSSYALKNMTIQNQTLRKQQIDLKNLLNSNEQQFNKKITIYQQNQFAFKRQNDDLKRRLAEYQSKLILVSQELDRLTNQLKTKTEQSTLIRQELQNTKRNFKKYQNDITNQFEGQIKRKFNQQDNLIKNLSKEIDQFKRKKVELETTNSRLISENERLSNNLKQANGEIESLKKSLNQYNLNITNYQVEVKNKYNIYEANMININKINEDLQRKLMESENYNRKRSQELAILENNNRQLSAENQNLKKLFKEQQYNLTQRYSLQINQKNQNIQQISSKLNQDNEELKRKNHELTNDFNKKFGQSQNRYKILSQEFQNLKRVNNSLGQEKEVLLKKLQSINNDYNKYQGDIKQKITIYEQNIYKYQNQIQQQRRKLQQAGDYYRRMSQYENKIALFSQQLQRLTNTLKLTKEENQSLKKQLRELQMGSQNNLIEFNKQMNQSSQRLVFLQKQNEQLKRRLNLFDQKYQQMQIQLNKLNSNLRLKVEQVVRYENLMRNSENENSRKVTYYEQNLKSLQQNNQELKKKLNQLIDINRKLTETEKRLIQASKQIDRLMEALRVEQQKTAKSDIINRNLLNDIQLWKKKYSDLQISFKSTYEFEIKKQFIAFEQTIADNNRKIGEYQGKMGSQVQEIQRLNNILRLKVEESSQFSSANKNIVAQYQQFKRKARENENIYNNNLSNFKRQNDDLRRKLQQFQMGYVNLNQQNQRKIGQYQKSLKGYNLQLQKSNQMLKLKNEELESLRKQFRQYEITMNNKFEGQIKTKHYQYQNNMNILGQQNMKLKKKIQEYENGLSASSKQFQRLNLILQNKQEDISKIVKQNEELRKKIYQLADLNRKVQEYQQRLLIFSQQNQKLQISLKNKIEESSAQEIRFKQMLQENQALKRSLKELEFNFNNKYQTQIKSKYSNYEQSISNLNRQKDEINRKRMEYQSKIALLSQQLERISENLNKKSQENHRLLRQIQNLQNKANQKIQSTESQYLTLENNYNIVIKQYDNAKKHLQEYQASIKKLYLEFERLQGIINQLKKERQALHQMNHNLSTQINRLTAENKDLEVQAQEVRLKLSDESALQKRINEHLSLMVILFAQIQTLRMRVKDKEKQVAQVRRTSLAPNIL